MSAKMKGDRRWFTKGHVAKINIGKPSIDMLGTLKGIILPQNQLMQHKTTLEAMGMHFFFWRWDYISAKLVNELVKNYRDKDFGFRGKIKEWTAEHWRTALKRKSEEEEGGLVWGGPKISLPDGMDVKILFNGEKIGANGYRVMDYKEPLQRTLAISLMSLFNPDRTTYLTISRIAFIERWIRGEAVNWGESFRRHIIQAEEFLLSGKPVYMGAFLVHLYRANGWLTADEMDMYVKEVPIITIMDSSKESESHQSKKKDLMKEVIEINGKKTMSNSLKDYREIDMNEKVISIESKEILGESEQEHISKKIDDHWKVEKISNEQLIKDYRPAVPKFSQEEKETMNSMERMHIPFARKRTKFTMEEKTRPWRKARKLINYAEVQSEDEDAINNHLAPKKREAKDKLKESSHEINYNISQELSTEIIPVLAKLEDLSSEFAFDWGVPGCYSRMVEGLAVLARGRLKVDTSRKEAEIKVTMLEKNLESLRQSLTQWISPTRAQDLKKKIKKLEDQKIINEEKIKKMEDHKIADLERVVILEDKQKRRIRKLEDILNTRMCHEGFLVRKIKKIKRRLRISKKKLEKSMTMMDAKAREYQHLEKYWNEKKTWFITKFEAFFVASSEASCLQQLKDIWEAMQTQPEVKMERHQRYIRLAERLIKENQELKENFKAQITESKRFLMNVPLSL